MAIPTVTDEQLDILAGKQEQPVVEPVEGIGIQDATVTDQDIMPETIPAPEIDPEGQQVAAFGLGDLTTGIAKRVLEAEKKVMPSVIDMQEDGTNPAIVPITSFSLKSSPTLAAIAYGSR